MAKHWTPADQAALEHALATGRLPDPDNRIATQVRLALYLGFSRRTIVLRLCGRRFPLCTELMREGGRSSAYKRAMARSSAIRDAADHRRA